MSKRKRKIICTVECPHCTKIIDVYRETEVIQPAVPADKKTTYIAEKSIQTTLPLAEGYE